MSTTDPAKSATNLILENFGVTSGYQEFGSARIDTETFIRAAYRPLLRQAAAALVASGAVLSRIRGSSSALAVELEVEAALAAVRAALGE